MEKANKFIVGKFIVYRIKVNTLPGLRNNVYAVVGKDITLIDAGFGIKAAAIINNAVKNISLEHNKKLTKVIITHSHIDHFGAIKSIKGDFETYAYYPDNETIKHFRKSIGQQEPRLNLFLKKAKIPLLESIKVKIFYKIYKFLFEGFEVKQLKNKLGEFEVINTPGHSPGHVCIKLEDALFTGDHILIGITPTQSPDYLNHGCGLEDYFNSLKKIEKMSFKIAFPAHEEPFTEIKKRIKEIIKHHEERLTLIESKCKGKSLYDIAKSTFGNKMKGYHTFLALMETAAHLEYLEEKEKIKEKNNRYYL